MRYVTLEDYQTAKNKIISDVDYLEISSPCECGCGQAIKMYSSKENGTFYEVDHEGIVEFWTNKHPASRYYSNHGIMPKSGFEITDSLLKLLIATNEDLQKKGLAVNSAEIRKNVETIFMLIKSFSTIRPMWEL